MLATVPAPVNSTTCGFDEALSGIVTSPPTLPTAVGLKVTWIAHSAPGATLAPQLLVSRNGPLVFMDETVKAVVPVLVRVTVCGALAAPTN
jgi:hypothetical protein